MPDRLLDSQALWKQLDGPQANAIIEGGRKWMKSWSVPMIKYFRNWNIDTASGRQLDYIGNIMGISRPIVIADFYFDQTFKFWQAPKEEGNPTGFAPAPSAWLEPGNTDPVQNGGVFDFLYDVDRPLNSIVDMTDIEYRFLLKTLANSPGELGSLLFVDYICYSYAKTNYQISSAYGVFADARPEDILIYLTQYMPRPYTSIESIMRTYVTPFPRVYINMRPKDEGV